MERAINRGRAMTKQRRLAIQMWQEIVDKCRTSDDFNLDDYKADFCKKHGLNWFANCYFCNYFNPCSKCPLDDKCAQVYRKVTFEHDVKSAEIILNALRGDANDYY